MIIFPKHYTKPDEMYLPPYFPYTSQLVTLLLVEWVIAYWLQIAMLFSTSSCISWSNGCLMVLFDKDTECFTLKPMKNPQPPLVYIDLWPLQPLASPPLLIIIESFPDIPSWMEPWGEGYVITPYSNVCSIFAKVLEKNKKGTRKTLRCRCHWWWITVCWENSHAPLCFGSQVSLGGFGERTKLNIPIVLDDDGCPI